MTTFACILFTVGAFKEVRERAGEKRATRTIRRGDMLETTTRQELHTHMQDKSYIYEGATSATSATSKRRRDREKDAATALVN